jgi:effector-binding domain-containing protein
MPLEMLPYWLDGAFGVIYRYLRDNDIATAGPPFARFTSIGDVVAVEAGVPTTTEIPGDGHIEPSVLPSGCAAVGTHWGHQDDVGHTVESVTNWLARQGCVPAGPHWEFYYTDPRLEPDPRRWRTEVVVPYRVA